MTQSASIERDENQLRFSRLLKLMEIAITRRPLTLLLLAPLTLYLPTYLIDRFWPPAPDKIISLDFLWWSIQVLPPSSLTAIFSGWIALQLFPGSQTSSSGIADAFTRSSPWVLTSLLVGVGVTLGTLLLFIPGMIFALACTVAVPAVAIEQRGPVEAVRRSMRLTQNRLWAILGYGMAVVLPLAAIAFVIELTFVDWDPRRLDQDPFVNNMLKPILETVGNVINAALTAAFYFELVRLQANSEGAELTASVTNSPPAASK